MDVIRILIADDHPLFRAGVRERLLGTDPHMVVVGEASDGAEAVKLVQELGPDVVLMDVSMPTMNGIEATRRLKKLRPDIPIVILTVYDDEQYIVNLLEAGASGYLLKTASPTELCRAIRQVLDGDSALSPSVARTVLTRFVARKRTPVPAPLGTVLSTQEQRVLRLAARGLSNKEIARQLGLSASTVHGHMGHVLGKLGVGSRMEAVVCALRSGWLQVEDLRSQ